MRLGQLVELPALRLTVVEPGGGLGRRVRWVYTTDLREPARYMAGGELVLTSLGWHRAPGDAATFVRSLVRARAAGLVAGLAERDGMPPDLLDACRTEGLALLTVPVEMSFNFLSETVVRLLLDERSRLARFAGSVEPGGTGALRVVADAAGGTCAHLSAAGAVRGCWPGPLPARVRARVWRAGVGSPGLPVTADGHTVLPVLAHDVGRLSGYLAVPGERRDWSDELALTVEAAVEHLGATAGHPPVAPAWTDHVHALATGAAPAGATPAGTKPDRPSTVVVLKAGLTGPPPGVLRQILAETPGGAGLVDGPDGTVLGYLPGPADAVRAHLDWYGTALDGGDRLRAGLSEPVPVGPALADALAAATAAYDWAARGPRPLAVVAESAVGTREFLLSLVPPRARDAHRARLVDPLVRHDERHGSQLLATVEVFLDSSGSWKRTAATLHVHVNTVRYRLRQAERLIGRSLRTERDRLDLHLALELRDT